MKKAGLPLGIWMQRVPQSYHDTCYELRGGAVAGYSASPFRYRLGGLGETGYVFIVCVIPTVFRAVHTWPAPPVHRSLVSDARLTSVHLSQHKSPEATVLSCVRA